MIGKSVINSRPAALSEVEGVMSKRMEEAEAEMKKMKKEKKVIPKPEPVPEPPKEGEEAVEGAPPAAIPAPPEEKAPLGLEQRTALEYAKKFSKIGKRKAEEMMAKLMKIEKMKPEVAVKMVDLMPLNVDQVKLVLAKEKISLGESEIASIMKTVEEFRK